MCQKPAAGGFWIVGRRFKYQPSTADFFVFGSDHVCFFVFWVLTMVLADVFLLQDGNGPETSDIWFRCTQDN